MPIRLKNFFNFKVSNYSLNLGKFLYHLGYNILAIILGSIATIAITIIVHAINVPKLSDFDFASTFNSVLYDWLYTDVFVAILTLSAVLVITYMVSFKKESKEYLGFFSYFVSWLAVVCVILCFLIIGLEIVYISHATYGSETNIGNLDFYNIIEGISLSICCFLQTFSHPEYYMSPLQNS